MKEGDIVYYIGENPEKYNLNYDTPYEIQSVLVTGAVNVYHLVGSVYLFAEKNIISENDYIIMKRKQIIEKIKNNICSK